MPKSIYIDENGNEQILSSSPSALSGLLDTDITTPTANQVLAYDGDNWVNKAQSQDLQFTGTTTAQGLLVSDIEFSNKIRMAYAVKSSTTYFATLRPSGSNKVVARLTDDNGNIANAVSDVTLYVFSD